MQKQHTSEIIATVLPHLQYSLGISSAFLVIVLATLIASTTIADELNLKEQDATFGKTWRIEHVA